MNWQPYIDKINIILKNKEQPDLTPEEIQKITHTWEAVLKDPISGVLISHSPEMLKMKLAQDFPNVIYGVLKASRKDYK